MEPLVQISGSQQKATTNGIRFIWVSQEEIELHGQTLNERFLKPRKIPRTRENHAFISCANEFLEWTPTICTAAVTVQQRQCLLQLLLVAMLAVCVTDSGRVDRALSV